MSATDHLSAARPRLGPLVAVGVPTAVFAAHAGHYGQWIEDDAGITFAYARSLATGAGPVLQPGADPVEGFSNPTWLAILVVGKLLRLFDTGTWFGVPDLVAFPKAVALLCAAGVFGCLYSAARAVSPNPVPVTVVAGSVTAAVPSFVIWSVSGLENALTALLVSALAAVLVRGAAPGGPYRLTAPKVALGCGALAGLAALTRPDGLIYVAAYPLAVLFLALGPGAARPIAASLGAAALPVGGYLGWRLATFGDWLPNTARAKEQDLPTLADVDRPAALVGYAGWSLALVAAAVVAVALHRGGPTRTAVAALLVPLGLAVAAFVTLAPDWMAQYRFSTPVWPLGALAATLAAAEMLRGRHGPGRLKPAVPLVVAVGLSLAGWHRWAETFVRSPTVTTCYPERLAGVRALAADLAGAVDAPYQRDPMRWWCPAVLRPTAPGTRPALELPG